MIAASAGVVLPPKLKSALPPVTACKVGAWFGNGPSHSTLMPSLASSLSNSPRSLAIMLRPLRPQVMRTRSVVQPVAARAGSPRSRPPRAPMPAAAVPRKRRRDRWLNEKSDICVILPGIFLRGGLDGEHAKFGKQCSSFNGCGAVRLAMLEGDGTVAHHQDAVGQRDRLIDIMRDQQDTGPMVGNELADEIVRADTGQGI